MVEPQGFVEGGDEAIGPSRLSTYRPLIDSVLVGLYRTFHSMRQYDRGNAVVQDLIAACLDAIQSAINFYGDLHFEIVRDACFANDVRIHTSADTFAAYQAVMRELRRRWIGEVEFDIELKKEELEEFLALLRDLDENEEENHLLLEQQLQERGITSIGVGRLKSYEGDVKYRSPEDLRHRSRAIYFAAIELLKEMAKGERTQHTLHVRKARRLMLSAIDVIARDESVLLGLANLKTYDEYTFSHSVNVAIYAIGLGQRLGFHRRQLNYLGIAALFHDVGKIFITGDILNKPGTLTDEEWEVIRTHPVRGALEVMQQQGWGELSSRTMAAAFEHHMRYDLSGYPKVAEPWRLSVTARIIALADCYDALGRPRVYRKAPFISERIIATMLERMGTDFDPILTKVFVNMIGVIPLGSLVELNTGEMAIVVKVQEDAALARRPTVRLVTQEAGRYRCGDFVDLSERTPSGDFRREIVRTLNPNDYDMNIEELYL